MSRSPSHLTGGIVWKNISGHQRIAIISDKSAGRDWKLPVVEQDPYSLTKKDPFKEIALLVGADVKDPISADTIFYPDADPPEYAIFWHLRVRANTRQFPPKDGKRVKWVSPMEAADKLVLESEKKLVKSAEFPGNFYDSTGGQITLRYDYQQPSSQSASGDDYERLEGDLRAHSAILEYRIRKNSLEDGSIPAWGEQAGALVNMAYEQLKRGKIDAAWKSLYASKRLAIFGMDSEDRNNLAKRFRQEAESVNQWRKKAIYRLLGEYDHQGTDHRITPSALYLAAEVRDEQFHVDYHRDRINKTVINTLLVLLTVTVGLIFAYLAYIIYQFPAPLISFPNGTRLVQTLPMMTGALLFGIFGGTMSALLTVKKRPRNPETPEFTHSHFFTIVRVFTGGTAAIVLFFFLESELFNILLPQLELRPSSGTAYFIISFFAGFAERFFFRTVSKDGAGK